MKFEPGLNVARNGSLEKSGGEFEVARIYSTSRSFLLIVQEHLRGKRRTSK